MRPQNLQLLTTSLNGSWVFLGRIAVPAAGTATNNATTAVPFNYQPRGGSPAPGASLNYADTLAGKTLIVMPVSDAVFVLPSGPDETLGQMLTNPVTVAAGARPGLRFGVGERPSFVMGQTSGWLQVISEAGGAASLLVWELT